ncbi:MAG: hypothetical protein NXI16_09165 [Alphaproteobacteria bacterium]|nr:hypothetical protein [Alphaproteobacteria bacterium]
MSAAPSALTSVAPTAFASARATAHLAVQPLSLAARANLPSATDDRHSNLGWRDGAFVSQPIPAGGAIYTVSLAVEPMALALERDGVAVARSPLDGQSPADVAAWLDDNLTGHGLKPTAGMAPPYDMPADVVMLGRYRTDPGLASLAAWYDLAHGVLDRFAGDHGDLEPGPSPLRCWPHHFDVATYVALETGDPETARGIGVGLSPGDESYPQPYLYVNPWPMLDPAGLPDLPAPGHWHTEGFVGAVATGEAILGLDDPAAGLAAFVEQAFAIGRARLGV